MYVSCFKSGCHFSAQRRLLASLLLKVPLNFLVLVRFSFFFRPSGLLSLALFLFSVSSVLIGPLIISLGETVYDLFDFVSAFAAARRVTLCVIFSCSIFSSASSAFSLNHHPQRSFLLYFSVFCSFISVSHLFSFTLSPFAPFLT